MATRLLTTIVIDCDTRGLSAGNRSCRSHSRMNMKRKTASATKPSGARSATTSAACGGRTTPSPAVAMGPWAAVRAAPGCQPARSGSAASSCRRTKSTMRTSTSRKMAAEPPKMMGASIGSPRTA